MERLIDNLQKAAADTARRWVREIDAGLQDAAARSQPRLKVWLRDQIDALVRWVQPSPDDATPPSSPAGKPERK